jgi:hypothetical protein
MVVCTEEMVDLEKPQPMWPAPIETNLEMVAG